VSAGSPCPHCAQGSRPLPPSPTRDLVFVAGASWHVLPVPSPARSTWFTCRAEETKTAAAPEKAAVEDKSLEIMRKFSEQYAKTSDTYFCVDKSVTAVVVKVGEPGHVGHTAWQ